jgi:hypothetical protein
MPVPTPKTAARQTRVAREARSERARIARVAPNLRLAYRSTSK